MKNITILGHRGNFGSFLHTLFLPHIIKEHKNYTVQGLDIHSPLAEQESLLAESHHVIPCFPLQVFHQLITDTFLAVVALRAQQSLHTTLWITASLQAPAFHHIRRCYALCPVELHSFVHVIGLHPMYGPHSFSTNERINRSYSLQNVLTHTSSDIAQQQATNAVALLATMGINTLHVESPEYHDRMVAFSQGLVFRFALLVEEDPVFSALLERYFPHLFFTFRQDALLMKAFLRLNPATESITFHEAWHSTGRSTREDVLKTFRLVDEYYNNEMPLITTRSYNELRALSRSVE
jgi:hypothetical protein